MQHLNNQNDASATASSSISEDKSNNLSLEEKASQIVEIINSDKPHQERSDQIWEIIK